MISEAEPIGVRSRHCGSSYIVCFFVRFNKKMLKPDLPSSSYICFLITVVLIGTFAILGFIHSLQQASKLCRRVCMWDFRQCMFFLFSTSGHLNWTSDMSVICEVLGYLKVVKMKRTPSVPSMRHNWGLSQKWQMWSTLQQRLEIVWRLMAHSEQRRYSGFLSMVKRITWEK